MSGTEVPRETTTQQTIRLFASVVTATNCVPIRWFRQCPFAGVEDLSYRILGKVGIRHLDYKEHRREMEGDTSAICVLIKHPEHDIPRRTVLVRERLHSVELTTVAGRRRQVQKLRCPICCGKQCYNHPSLGDPLVRHIALDPEYYDRVIGTIHEREIVIGGRW